jgi:DSF synthase
MERFDGRDAADAPVSIQSDILPVTLRHDAAAHPTKLFDLGQIDVEWDESAGCLWAYLTPEGLPNCNQGLLRDTARWQAETVRLFGLPNSPLKYVVLASRYPGIFNLGGDLEMFATCIERQDRQTLLWYGRTCIEIVHNFWYCGQLPIINIALAQGDALGGGFEALMCFDTIIAERQARFGLPEILFGLFPGMGAHSILSRRVGHNMAQHILHEGRIFSADEMHEIGLVAQVVETGKGAEAVRRYMADTSARHSGHVGILQAGRRINPLTMEELGDIVENWVDIALRLSPADLRTMRRLSDAQKRMGRH